MIERVAERGDDRADLLGTELRHRLDVRARGEDLRPAPDHHGADVVAFARLAERLLELHARPDGRSRSRADDPARTTPDPVVHLEPDELPHRPRMLEPYRPADGRSRQRPAARRRARSDRRRTPRPRRARRPGTASANSSAVVGETGIPSASVKRAAASAGRQRHRRPAPGAARSVTSSDMRHDVGSLQRPRALEVPVPVVGRGHDRRDVAGEDRRHRLATPRRPRTAARRSRPRPSRPARARPAP